MGGAAPAARSTQVAIVGGGPVGLSAACLLGRFGIETVLLERRATTSVHPKAHVLNSRTMELLRTWGIEQEVRDRGLPPDRGLGIGFVTRLTGRELGAIRFTDSPELLMEALSQSPSLPCSCPQDLVEPVLRDAAAAQPSVELQFGVTVEGLDQQRDGVTVHARAADGTPRAIVASYVLAADGARSPCREMLGIARAREAELGHQTNIYFEADLRRHVENRPYVLSWVLNPQTIGVFIALDGANRWVYNFPSDPEGSFPPERCVEIVRQATGVASLDVDVKSVLPWRMESFFAESFRSDRAFLLGDSAHAFPPTGGFGLNTGVGDAHNLCWKLAATLRGEASPDLLDTYELERAPVARFNAEQSVRNFERLTQALAGAVAGDVAGFGAIEAPEGEPLRGRLAAIVPEQREHFEFQGQAMGFAYESPAIVADGTPPEPSTVARYHPSARPGSRAPHLWLRRDGAQVSTIDLFEGRYTVLAGEDGAVWCDAARRLAANAGVSLVALTVGSRSDLVDEESAWTSLYGVGAAGAVLVRPDGHVAWRCAGVAGDPEAELSGALAAVLGRSSAHRRPLEPA